MISLKVWWYKHVIRSWARARYYEKSLGDADDFAVLKEGLREVLQLAKLKEISEPNSGICLNAGFMGRDLVAPICRADACTVFLQMCKEFNRVHGRTHVTSWTQPFADIDFCSGTNSKWEGDSASIRIQAMEWILSEIEKYNLDSFD